MSPPLPQSLRLRLLLGTALLVGVVIAALGGLARGLLHEAAQDQWVSGLSNRLESLRAYAGTLDWAEISPGLYAERYSGNYWQVESPAAQSPSLGGFDLLQQADGQEDGAVWLEGPLQEPLLGLVRSDSGPENTPQRWLVARDATPLLNLRQSMDRTLLWTLGMLWLATTLTAALAATWVARPLRTMAEDLGALHSGQRSRIRTQLPSELKALAQELNRVLELNEQRIRRQRETAANLAHELKTPLTALQQQAELHAQIDAIFVRDKVQRMWPPLEQELGRARIHGPAPGLAPVLLREQIERAIPLCVADHRVRPEDFIIDVPQALTLPAEARDLFTLVWNLLDNAVRHGSPPVHISMSPYGLSIEDSGAAERTPALNRPSGGAGLTLVSHILDAYGWSLETSASALGGRRCLIQFGNSSQ